MWQMMWFKAAYDAILNGYPRAVSTDIHVCLEGATFSKPGFRLKRIQPIVSKMGSDHITIFILLKDTLHFGSQTLGAYVLTD